MDHHFSFCACLWQQQPLFPSPRLDNSSGRRLKLPQPFFTFLPVRRLRNSHTPVVVVSIFFAISPLRPKEAFFFRIKKNFSPQSKKKRSPLLSSIEGIPPPLLSDRPILRGFLLSMAEYDFCLSMPRWASSLPKRTKTLFLLSAPPLFVPLSRRSFLSRGSLLWRGKTTFHGARPTIPV